MLPLKIRDLDVRYPGLEQSALKIPVLDIAPGARVAVTGPSGAGKTTLVNLLTGLERLRHGSLVWGETDLATLPESRRDAWRARHVGLVMQDFHLFSGISAIDNVLLPQRLARFRLPSETREEAARLLRRVGIDKINQSAETLSRGQMQRVAIARALVARPALLVADEPTASLDAEAGATVCDLIMELATESGCSLIVASHDARLVDKLDIRISLRNGRIERLGNI